MEIGNNKTIAKNTLALYARSILMMLIGLYTSRVILDILGVKDFGIYSTVGGVITFVSIITTSLGTATSRFVTVALGSGDEELLKKTYSNIKFIYYCLSFIVFVLGETIGLWFLKSQIVIAPERQVAASFVYQFSVFSTILSLICVPYNSAIIAHEKMTAFAYISLFDVVLKLLICYLLAIIPVDRLITYSFLLFVVGNIDRIIYQRYSYKHFMEVRVKAIFDREQFKSIASISGWQLIAPAVYIGNDQGTNILMNNSFGPATIAAKGVALQVQGTITLFVANFQTAINPQIIKSYAGSNLKRVQMLFNLNNRFSFFLLFLLSVPIFINAPYILRLWLVKVPTYTIDFLRLICIQQWIGTLIGSFNTTALATGKMKKLQIFEFLTKGPVLPICFYLVKYTVLSPISVFMIFIAAELSSLIAKFFIVLPQIHYAKISYLKNVIFRILPVAVLAPILPYYIYTMFNEGLMQLVVSSIVSLIVTFLFIWYIGIYKNERDFIFSMMKSKMVHK